MILTISVLFVFYEQRISHLTLIDDIVILVTSAPSVIFVHLVCFWLPALFQYNHAHRITRFTIFDYKLYE